MKSGAVNIATWRPGDLDCAGSYPHDSSQADAYAARTKGTGGYFQLASRRHPSDGEIEIRLQWKQSSKNEAEGINIKADND